jgi:hypothetical protein
MLFALWIIDILKLHRLFSPDGHGKEEEEEEVADFCLFV